MVLMSIFSRNYGKPTEVYGIIPWSAKCRLQISSILGNCSILLKRIHLQTKCGNLNESVIQIVIPQTGQSPGIENIITEHLVRP